MAYAFRFRSILLATLFSGGLSGFGHACTMTAAAVEGSAELHAAAIHVSRTALPAIAVSLYSSVVVELCGRCGGSSDRFAARSGVGARDRPKLQHISLDAQDGIDRLVRAGLDAGSLGTPPPQF